MAELGEGGGGGHGKHEKRRAKKPSGRVDMTPMVDLGFLLLTFFVLTSTLKEPKAMDLVVPAKKENTTEKATQFPAARTINILLAENNKVYYYWGGKKDGEAPEFKRTTYGRQGLRKVLLDRNQRLNKEIEALEQDVLNNKLPKDSLKPAIAKAKMKSMEPQSKTGVEPYGILAIIKATDKSTYKNLVDVFDELNITNIANKAIVKPAPWELEALSKAP